MTEDTDADGHSEGRADVQDAVREIRREGWKAAALHALVDGAAAFLVVNLLIRVTSLAVPAAGPVPGRIALAMGVGLVVLAAEAGWRRRRYTVRRFEADNPAVAEALRTARDAAAAGAATPVARRLYRDVRDRLDRTSAAAFVDVRWLTASLLVLGVVSLATVHVAVAGIDISSPGPADDNGTARDAAADVSRDDATTAELRDAEEVLGNRSAVADGQENLDVNVSGTTGGEGSVIDDGQGSDVTVDPALSAEEAGYDPATRPRDASLVREYNLRLRSETDD